MTVVVTPPAPSALPTLRVDPEPDVGGPDQTSGPDTHVAEPRRMTGGLVAEILLLTVSLSASLGVARLIQGGLGHAVVFPLSVSVLAGALVSGLAARRGLPIVFVAILGLLAVALATIWTVAPGPTFFGVPTITTAHALAAEIRTARSIMGSHRTPVPGVPGVILIAALSAGAVCVAARTLWEISRRYARFTMLFALVPTLGMFCYSAPLSARIDRPQTAIFFLLTVLGFFIASDSSGRMLKATGRHDGVRSAVGTYVPILLSTATALLVLVLAAGALSGTVPVAFPWWDHPPSGPTGLATGPVGHVKGLTALGMVANLQTAVTSSSSVKMFLATSEIPTYWEVGILNRFDGTKWLPGADETAALSGAANVPTPPEPALPPDPTTFISFIQVQNYSGRLLPAPPSAQALQIRVPSFRISDGLGVVIPSLIGSGDSYDIVAPVPSVPSLSSGPQSLSEVYAGLGTSRNQYLGLPSGIPSSIGTIARSIVAGAKTPLQQAQLLVDYFHNQSFVYTLSPPATPPGENPLVWFLDSRAGFCQQFAGAFGVLAREIGLPVRLAIGFTAGVPVSKSDPHQYEVTGADAHVWPEVYLGAQLGWVSFEPTPSPPNGQPNGVGVVNSRSLKASKGPTTSSTVPKRVTKVRIPLPHTPSSVQPVAAIHHAKRSTPLPAGAIVGGIFIVLAAIGGFVFWRRSKRYVRPVLGFGNRSSDPDEVVLRAWLRASSALGRAGFQRSQWVTPAAHAASIRAAILDRSGGSLNRGESTAAVGVATYGYTELSELAELACYCPGRCTSRDARHAEQEAWRIERALRNSGLFRWFPTPPPKAAIAVKVPL